LPCFFPGLIRIVGELDAPDFRPSRNPNLDFQNDRLSYFGRNPVRLIGRTGYLSLGDSYAFLLEKFFALVFIKSCHEYFLSKLTLLKEWGFLSTDIEGIFWIRAGIQGCLGLAVRGTGERDSDVGDILLAQPAQQGYSIINHFFQKSKAR
jgi:hypothetical protein